MVSPMNARAYLRASSLEHDASRAKSQVEAFAAERGLDIVGWFVENESGAKLARPELFRLLADSRPGDVLLVEQVDRLSRLSDADWRELRTELEARQIRVVALDLPTSWQLAAPGDEFTARMFAALNAMMLDMLAAVAARTTKTAVADRRKESSTPRRLARTAAGRKIPRATPALPACCVPACRGRPFKRRRVAAERQSPRSPSGPRSATKVTTAVARVRERV
jgi:DNA invertase Pin-like site-specific DNA recombinase